MLSLTYDIYSLQNKCSKLYYYYLIHNNNVFTPVNYSEYIFIIIK